MNPETLAAWSLVGVYSAAAVYLGAFVVFMLDLAKRSSVAPAKAQQATTASLNGSTGVLVDAPPAPPTVAGPSRNARVAFALTIVGWVVQVAAIVLRGVAAERVPWANMFEFALTGTGIIVGVFVVANLWKDLRFLGTFVTGLAVLLLVLATRNLYVDVVPLPPALDSAWLVVHVLVAILATGFFALGAGLSITQLLQTRREASKLPRARFLTTLPTATALETLAYRVNVIGFVLWTFVIWVVFAGYIHARATRGWRGSRSAILALVGFAAVLFNFTVVNLFFTGLHAYSGL